MITAVGLLAVILLIAANGYFVAAEFAFVAAKRARLEDGAATGDRKAGRAVQVHKRLSFMLSGAQLGITVTSLAVGFVAEPTLGRALEPVVGAVGVPEGSRFGVALTVGFVLATAAQMVFGELAPKNLAIAKPEPVARSLAGSTLVFLNVASPLIRLFDGAANRLLRAVGIEPVEELHGGVSVEELDLIVNESAEHGKLSARQAGLLKRAIDFGGLHASAAMVPWNRVTTVRDDTTCDELREGLRATAHSRFPVVDADGQVVGLVHAKYLLGIDDDELATTPVAGLARPALALPETARLRTVLTALRGEAAAMALVVDEYGAPAGVISLEDLVEELVGDISDEYDAEEPRAEHGEDGSWTVPGSWRIDEVERMTGVVLPADAAYDTVAGLVLTRRQRVPAVGDAVEAGGATLEVAAMDGWAVTRVRITPLADTPETPEAPEQADAPDWVEPAPGSQPDEPPPDDAGGGATGAQQAAGEAPQPDGEES